MIKYAGDSTKRYEDVPKTITNRFGQKVISLPRRDKKKDLYGYPGLSSTAKAIAELVPKCTYYVEPFAGMARVYQELPRHKYDIAILNDRSRFICDWLYKTFEDALILKWEFADIFKYFSYHDAFMLIDPPWYKKFYDQNYSCFDRDSIKDYDEEILGFLFFDVIIQLHFTSRNSSKISSS